MPTSIKNSFDPKLLLANAIVAFVYILAGKFSLNLATFHPSVSAIWVPTGIAIALVTIYGNKIWPGIFAGAFITNANSIEMIIPSIGISIGNTLEGLVGAWFLKNFVGKETFYRPLNIFKYFFSVGVFATFISAVIGTSSLLINGVAKKETFSYALTTWWIGDMGGALMVTPFILLWWNKYRLKFRFWKFIEFIFCIALISAINTLIFSGKIPGGLLQPLAGFFSFPIIIWVASRFGPKETSLSILVVYVIIVIGAFNAAPSIVAQNINEVLLTIQIYMAIVFITVMPLASAVFEQNKIKRILKERSERYKKLIEISPNSITVSDINGIIRFANKKALELYGYPDKKSLVGRSAFKLIAAEDLEKTRSALKQIRKNGKIENLEFRGRKKNGNVFYSSANATLFYDTNGNPQGIVTINHDISHIKEIDKIKSEFISLASHQLRTPLTSMRWIMEMLLGGEYGELPRQRKLAVKTMYGSLLRLVRIVDDLLNITRLEENRSLDSPTLVNTNDLIEKVINRLKPSASKKGVSIIFRRLSKTTKPIIIDIKKFGDVIENLLSNAIKYNKQNGKVVISIEERRKFVQLKFKDTGLGISNFEKGKIFTKFYRTSEASRSDTEGSGLGLYLVKSYVENWGGKVYLESKLKKGTTFTIEIPKKPTLKINFAEQLEK